MFVLETLFPDSMRTLCRGDARRRALGCAPVVAASKTHKEKVLRYYVYVIAPFYENNPCKYCVPAMISSRAISQGKSRHNVPKPVNLRFPSRVKPGNVKNPKNDPIK